MQSINWNVQNVIDMFGMFGNCYELQSLDINNWNTRNVQNMNYMFYNCPAPKPSWFRE